MVFCLVYSCCDAGESGGKMCVLRRGCCWFNYPCSLATSSSQCTHLNTRLSRITTTVNRTENHRQWNAVRPPDDGRKDARNMLRITNKSLFAASSWSHLHLLLYNILRSYLNTSRTNCHFTTERRNIQFSEFSQQISLIYSIKISEQTTTVYFRRGLNKPWSTGFTVRLNIFTLTPNICESKIGKISHITILGALNF
jgi:hypothetical protein